MARKRAAKEPEFKRVVVPDLVDLRDRVYMPHVREAPEAALNSLGRRGVKLPILDQRDTSACTGFALANVVNFLLQMAGRARETPVSPFMIYSMARRYDEFPGEDDSGSSLRGAMKGWYRHGVCADELWPTTDPKKVPPARKDPTVDWWQNGARRPLGAYYRVDTRSVTDMHVALAEVGVLYASAVCHSGWNLGLNVRPQPKTPWPIPYQKALPDDGGHAFVLVGYTREGFIVLNSWGTAWGAGGLGILTYRDWLEHAMDCWVPQLGVVTAAHVAVSEALSLRMPQPHKVSLSADRVLRNRELSPFIVDMENNGELSETGEFRTSADDLKALVTLHLDEFRRQWKLSKTDVIDVAIYAHGGLTGEETAADTAARWIPALYEARIFPIFLMWETDLFATLRNKLEDEVEGIAKPTAGVIERLQNWWNQRLERALARPGSVIWGEMKQNARAISESAKSGARILYQVAEETKAFEPKRVRLHLVGHSAGGIVHSYVVKALAAKGWSFKSVTFLAPAVTVAEFKDTVIRHLLSGRVEQYTQFHLTDEQEERDPTCRPIVGYGRSLLYLVSESFEHGVQTPILGMQKYFESEMAELVPGRLRSVVAPGPSSQSATHGEFDNDARTLQSVITLIKGTQTGAGPAPARAAARGVRAARAPAAAAAPPSAVSRWFGGLAKIQTMARNLNHETEAGLKAFSQQTLGKLLVSDLMEGNVAQFCQNEGIGMVPTDAFSDGTKTFRWFVDRIRSPIEAALLMLAYAVAVKRQPKWLDGPPSKLAPERLDSVFSEVALRDLDAVLRQAVPGDFYPADGSLLDDGKQSVGQLIESIVGSTEA